MNFEIKVLDQFVNEEGSDQEKACWNKIKAAMCETNACAQLCEVRAIANNTLYFNDGSDYKKALWSILRILSPELFSDGERPDLKLSE